MDSLDTAVNKLRAKIVSDRKLVQSSVAMIKDTINDLESFIRNCDARLAALNALLIDNVNFSRKVEHGCVEQFCKQCDGE